MSKKSRRKKSEDAIWPILAFVAIVFILAILIYGAFDSPKLDGDALRKATSICDSRGGIAYMVVTSHSFDYKYVCNDGLMLDYWGELVGASND